MQNWQKSRNFRKHKNSNGSYSYVITVDSEKVEVSEAVYTAYAKGGYKMENMEALKNDRVLKDANGKAIRDEHGNAVMLSEREVSLDKLIEGGWDFPGELPSPEDFFIINDFSEIDELHRCIALLSDEEQALIKSLFFESKTIREYAEVTGQTKSTVDRQKTKIIGKLKNIFAN